MNNATDYSKVSIFFRQDSALFLLLMFSLWIQGCTSITSALTDEPIQVDPGKRLLGTYVNDEKLEAIAKDNIDKTHADLKKANINIGFFIIFHSE